MVIGYGQDTILPVKLENYSYARYLSELLTLCNKHHIKHNIIGFENFKKIKMIDPLYNIIVNPRAKIHFLITCGVQAYEIASPLTILTLMHHPEKYLDKNICYRIYPMINPTSFDLRQRCDEDHHDLNTLTKATLKSKNFVEVKDFYQDIKGKKFDFFLDMHEDIDENRFYMYPFEKKKEKIYRDMIKSVSKHHRIWKAKSIYGAKSDGQGLILNAHDRSFEDRLFRDRIAALSVCTETPGKLSLESRVHINLNNIKLISRYLLRKNKTKLA